MIRPTRPPQVILHRLAASPQLSVAELGLKSLEESPFLAADVVVQELGELQQKGLQARLFRLCQTAGQPSQAVMLVQQFAGELLLRLPESGQGQGEEMRLLGLQVREEPLLEEFEHAIALGRPILGPSGAGRLRPTLADALSQDQAVVVVV